MENDKAHQDLKEETPQSPTTSQQTVSDDEEIDYSIKPEFYDPTLDDKDELWAQKNRSSYFSDAVLSCPACFTTLCLESQRHETIVTQYRAIFVLNCKINETDLVQEPGSKRKRGGRKTGANADAAPMATESFKRVCCAVCSTHVGVIDEEEVRDGKLFVNGVWFFRIFVLMVPSYLTFGYEFVIQCLYFRLRELNQPGENTVDPSAPDFLPLPAFQECFPKSSKEYRLQKHEGLEMDIDHTDIQTVKLEGSSH